jgi:hypothetical protein
MEVTRYDLQDAKAFSSANGLIVGTAERGQGRMR